MKSTVVSVILCTLILGPILFTDYAIAQTNKITYDSQDIPRVWYNGYGYMYNPVTTSGYIIGLYDKYKNTGNQALLSSIKNNADSIVSNINKYNAITGFLEYHFNYNYNMTAPWRSAMAQGRAIEALTDAYDVTHDQKYLDNAKLLLYGFCISVENGGVTHKSDPNGWWYEEYADDKGRNPRVLNGMLYTLLGIYHYYNYTHDEDAKYFFDIGINAVKNNIANYDPKEPNIYSYYDALHTTSPKSYNDVHITLLHRLYNITGSPILLQYADKWSKLKVPDTNH